MNNLNVGKFQENWKHLVRGIFDTTKDASNIQCIANRKYAFWLLPVDNPVHITSILSNIINTST